MANPEWSFVLAIMAGVLDIGANMASVKSEGFSKRGWGVLSIVLVVSAFGLLAVAIRGSDLAVAYAVLGATGIFGTAICGRIFFGNKLKPIAWVGFIMVIGAVVVLHSASTHGI
jgi:spermidine export protein MdtI